MTRHAGASVFLSVLVVVFFAVVLYQPEHPPVKPRASGQLAGADSPRSVEAASSPASTPGVPLVEHPAEFTQPVLTPVPVRPRQVSVARQARDSRMTERPLPAGAGAAVARKRHATIDPPATARRSDPASRPPNRSRPRSSFTEATEGETLEDVAVRVYGTSDAARDLWRANRDIVERREAPLVAGTLLRTP